MVDTNKIRAAGEFSGFKNYTTSIFSVSYAGGSILAGAFAGVLRASTPLNNGNAISEVQIQYSGIETFYQKIPGNVTNEYPNASATTYEIQSLTYFSGATLFVDSYIVNQTAGTITVPAITFNCRAFLYVAPF